MFATRCGTVKKTELQAYNTPIKADGIIAINIRDDDELVAVRRVDEGDEVLMVSRAGLTVRFSEADARAHGPRHERRARHGRRPRRRGHRDGHRARRPVPARRDGERLRQAHARSATTARPAAAPRASRRSSRPRRRARWPAALVVRDHHQLVFISQNGMVQRIAVRELRPLGRNAQGFRLMNVRDDDVVSAVALVVESEAAAAVAGDGPVSIDAARRRRRAGAGGRRRRDRRPGRGHAAVPARGRVDDEHAGLRPRGVAAPAGAGPRPTGRRGCRGGHRNAEGPVDTGPSVNFLLDYLAVASCLAAGGTSSGTGGGGATVWIPLTSGSSTRLVLAAGHLQGPVRTVTQLRTTPFLW